MNTNFLLLTLISSHIAHASTDIAIPLLPLRQQQENVDPFYFSVAVASARNVRPYMEDRYDIFVDPKGIFLAVYDGHGGDAVAEYAKENLHIRLFNHPDFDSDIKKAMGETFKAIHTEVDQDKFGRAGTTAVIALIKDGKIHLAWAGDSRAVVGSKDTISSSIDHKPTGKELERVIKSGGRLEGNHVFSRDSIYGIAMTRALGDRDLKNILIPDPQISSKDLDPADEFIIVASDGIWDALNNQRAAHIVRNKLKKDPRACEAAARELIHQSRCSRDNQTAIVASLLPPLPPKPPNIVWRWLSKAFCCGKGSKAKEKMDDPLDQV